MFALYSPIAINSREFVLVVHRPKVKGTNGFAFNRLALQVFNVTVLVIANIRFILVFGDYEVMYF